MAIRGNAGAHSSPGLATPGLIDWLVDPGAALSVAAVDMDRFRFSMTTHPTLKFSFLQYVFNNVPFYEIALEQSQVPAIATGRPVSRPTAGRSQGFARRLIVGAGGHSATPAHFFRIRA